MHPDRCITVESSVKRGGESDAVQDGFSPGGFLIREVPFKPAGIQDSPVGVMLWWFHGHALPSEGVDNFSLAEVEDSAIGQHLGGAG